MALQDSCGLLAIPGLVPLGAALGAPCGVLCLHYEVLSRKATWTLPRGKVLLCPQPRTPFTSPCAREGASMVPPTESPNTGANPRCQQPWKRNPRGLQTGAVQPRVKNATLSSSQALRCSCCQNLYKQITLLSGIQQETEREIPCSSTLETGPQYSE